MLTGMHVVVLGGDARQLEVIKRLVELDAKVSIIGFTLLENVALGATKCSLQEIDVPTVDAFILPVPGINLEGEIDSVFSSEKVKLTKELVERTKPECLFFTGISNQLLESIMNSTKRKLIRLFDRDDVAIYNSIPTVEGTIMMAIQNTDYTIHGSNVVVLGLGRCGMSVARTFAALGAHVKVGARKSADLARIHEMGLVSFHMKDLATQVTDTDICINTVPSMILDANVLSQMPAHTLIIDLASKPGGTDFRYAEKRGIKALLAPGLPGIVAPKSAGKILANVLAQLLFEEKDARKE